METETLKNFIITLLTDKFLVIHKILQKLEEDVLNLQNKIASIEENSAQINNAMMNQVSEFAGQILAFEDEMKKTRKNLERSEFKIQKMETDIQSNQYAIKNFQSQSAIIRQNYEPQGSQCFSQSPYSKIYQNPSQIQSNQVKVFTTQTGDKYHRLKGRCESTLNSTNIEPMTLEEAQYLQRKGKIDGPCKDCFRR